MQTVKSANQASRRQLIGLAACAITALGAPSGDVSQTAESIHQEPVFKANRKRIYDALTDAKQFDKIVELSGATKEMNLGQKTAEINREAGGSFSIFGGYITGRQVELIPNELIVQAWRVGNWKSGVYSIARFELVGQASSTKIVFDHTGFPVGSGQHLADGWKAHYWEPLEKLLGA
jgi:activator of HSP90 ATPase